MELEYIEIDEYSDMPDIVIEYFHYLQTIKNKSNNTIMSYRLDLRLFFRYMLIHKKVIEIKEVEFDNIDISHIDIDFIKEIKLRDFYAFLNYLEKVRNNSSKSRGRKITCLKSFFNYMQTKAKVITINPTLELESPKVGTRQRIYLTLEQSMRVLESMNPKKKTYYRDYCIMIIFLNTGLRLSELCNIKLTDISGESLRVIGKGDKERIIYLNVPCMKTLKQYLSTRDTSNVEEKYKNYLFLSNRGLPINKRTVQRLVKQYTINAGVGDIYSPHKLRHTCATLLHKHGNVDVRELQEILGHANISTTEIYTHIDSDDIKDAMERNPLTNLF